MLPWCYRSKIGFVGNSPKVVLKYYGAKYLVLPFILVLHVVRPVRHAIRVVNMYIAG